MNIKKPLSISSKMLWGGIIIGIFRVAFGIIGCFESVDIRFIATLFLVLSAVIQVVLFMVKSEEDDEMSESYLKEAKSMASDISNIIILCLITVLLIASVFVDTKEITKRLSADILNLAIHVPFIFIGINNIMTGVIFRKLEAE